MALLFTPAEDARLKQQPAVVLGFLIDLLPLGEIGCAGAIGAAAASYPVLQDASLMKEQALAFFALGADIKADLGLIESGVHDEPATTLGTIAFPGRLLHDTAVLCASASSVLDGWFLVVGPSRVGARLIPGGGSFGLGTAEGAFGDARVVAKFLERGLDFFYLLAMSALAGKVGDATAIFDGVVAEDKQSDERIRVQLPQ